MKRLTLLTILLVVVGLTAGFAQEVKPTITLSGSGTLEWGIDLDNQATGFKNTASSTAVLNFPAGAATKGGKDGWYGEITLAAPVFKWSLDQASTATVTLTGSAVTAKIVGMGGALAIGVVGAPDLAIAYVSPMEADTGATDPFIDAETGPTIDYNGPGTYVSYQATKDIMLGFEIVSENSWTVNVPNAYAFQLETLAKFPPITVRAAVNYGVGYAANNLGFGVKVNADVAPIAAWVGFDGLAATPFAYDVGGGLTFTVMPGVTAKVDAVFSDPNYGLDLSFGFAEAKAKGLVDNLAFGVDVWLLDVLTSLEYKVAVTGGYQAGALYPNFSVTYYDAANPVDLDPVLTVKVGVDAALIPNTVFTLYWTSGDLLLATPVMGTLVAGAKVSF